MSLLPIFGLALLLALPTPVARANDVQASESVSQRWNALFSDQESGSLPGYRTGSAPIYQTSLAPTFFVPPVTSPRLRDLAPETDQARTRGTLSSSSWFKGNLVTETEVANNQGGAGWLQSKIPGDTRTDASERMMRMGFTGTSGALRYGMHYRSAGQAFLNGPDLATREMWGEWKTGWTTFRSSVGQLWNNVAGDSSRSRLEQTYGRVGLIWNRPAWPNLSLTYSKNSLNSAMDPAGIAPQRMMSHTLEAALAYQSASWDALLASSYNLGNDLMRNGADSTVKVQMMTASFRPLNTLTIAPTFTYRAEIQDWSGVRINSPIASLALHYMQSYNVRISAMGNYIGTRSSDGLIDTENVGGRGTLAWNMQRSNHWATLVSIEAGYNRLSNRVMPADETEDISGLIRFVVAAL
ncbi:conserved exported protein of unknown function [Nitrospira sp. KM1]|uniref:hypothetical protein n=1 Tax=Nitrospira sp. KM1 TaxID=1936990 RepID=UPI0013A78BDD|nr:hypothetical protein [Nitrospira sp. KM1]BCA54054.1 conserved exported protein of unknown function [Nitrospira sp. KM1]